MKLLVSASQILQGKKTVYSVGLAYLLLGLFWIILSHTLPKVLTADPVVAYRIQGLLDLFLVLLTAVLLLGLTNRLLGMLRSQEQEILRIIDNVCSATGDEFFPGLVQSLTKAVGANYAFICEFTDETSRRVRTVAACADGKIVEPFEFDLAETPCRQVVAQGLMCFPDSVRERFPLDHVAAELEVESYTGIPLKDSTGKILGPMAVFGREPLKNRRLAETMLQLFAVRAAAELERKNAEETIDYMACYDSLTGLPNRRKFVQLLGPALTHARLNREHLSVMFLDLDHFKNINDTLGHAVGDRLLKQVAERITATLRRVDTVARLGGDEFMLSFPGLARPDDAGRIAAKIHDCLKPAFSVDGMELHIASSIGITLYPEFGSDPETLLRNADTAMNRAKELGRNNYQFYSHDMNANSLRRLGLENQLRKALERQELVLHYQPQYDIDGKKVVGMEALLRWNHPQRGLLGPNEFISLAEETGLIVPIGKWVIRQACLHNRALQDAGYPPARVGVNLSARQFHQSDLVEYVAETLAETGLDAQWLELEITESVLMDDLENTIDQLVRMMELGLRIAIDDFGTGYSSLSYLKRFPIHVLKVDRSFVKDLEHDSDDASIVSAIIALAHSLKLEVVAEGVETQAQLEFLRSRRCQTLQGFLFSPPIDFEALQLHLSVDPALPPQDSLSAVKS